jgi:hypothetical protein
MLTLEVSTLPKKKILDPYFSTIKKRAGTEPVPFAGLDTGDHEIRFETKTKFLECIVKHWLSPYGYAWQIITILKEGKK